MVAVQQEGGGRERILIAARDLFAIKGFHQTSVAELAAYAAVSVGQIYRLFKGKEDIIAAIVASDANERAMDMERIYNRLDAGEIDVEDGLRLVVLNAQSAKDEAFSFDIMAEAFRNEAVGETIASLCIRYKELLGRFACEANPRLSGEALEAAKELMLACLFGLAHRTLSRPTLDLEVTAARTTAMLMAALRGIA